MSNWATNRTTRNDLACWTSDWWANHFFCWFIKHENTLRCVQTGTIIWRKRAHLGNVQHSIFWVGFFLVKVSNKYVNIWPVLISWSIALLCHLKFLSIEWTSIDKNWIQNKIIKCAVDFTEIFFYCSLETQFGKWRDMLSEESKRFEWKNKLKRKTKQDNLPVL